jgi:hypothetical protein
VVTGDGTRYMNLPQLWVFIIMIDIGVTGERHQTLQAQAYSKHLLPFKSRMFSALTVSLLLALFVVIKRRCKKEYKTMGCFHFGKSTTTPSNYCVGFNLVLLLLISSILNLCNHSSSLIGC